MNGEDRHRAAQRRAQWMAAAQRGDADAYGALLNDLGPILMNFLRRRVADAEDAEDVYQEIFMALHRGRHSYQPARPFEPWFFAIARRMLKDHHRRRRTHRATELLVDALPDVSVESDLHLKPQLEQAVHHLSPNQRRALESLGVDGLSTAAAARRAGTSSGALRVRAHRAYKVFRQLL